MRKRVTVRTGAGAVVRTPHTPKFVSPDYYVFEGDIEVDIADIEQFVNVQVAGASGSWTYRDPFDTPAGNYVLVPFGVGDSRRPGLVVATNVLPKEGMFIKDIEAQLKVAA